MTTFKVTPHSAAKLYYTVKILFAQDFNWVLTKKTLTLSNSDYTSGFRVTVPVESDGEEEFSMISEYAVMVLEAMRSDVMLRIDFGSLSVTSPVTGVSTQYLINSYHDKKGVFPTAWGKDYSMAEDELDAHATARIVAESPLLVSRSIMEMSHGNSYIGSATVPNAFVLKSKVVSEVPDYITAASHAHAAGWLLQTAPGSHVSINVTDKHVRTNIGDDYVYTARYDFEPHLMEKAILNVKLLKYTSVPIPAAAWWEVLPAEHNSAVVVTLKKGILKMATTNIYGVEQSIEKAVDTDKEFTLEFMPTALPTGMGLLGRASDGVLEVPTSGTSVILETARAEVLVPATVKVKE